MWELMIYREDVGITVHRLVDAGLGLQDTQMERRGASSAGGGSGRGKGVQMM